MKFKIDTERADGTPMVLTYDNMTNILTEEATGNVFELPSEDEASSKKILPVSIPFSKDSPLTKSSNVRILKIQLGLSCNYSCDYCSQRFVKPAPETTPKDIENFLSMLDNLEFSESDGLRIEFWGGEPFVYWKTLKPLAEALAAKFSSWQRMPNFSVITNGSLLTEEICAWLYAMNFQVGISHDGPGQSVRGPDPFDDPKLKQVVLDFYKIMRKHNRISFNAMLNAKNISRKAIQDWFIEFTGDPDVPLGEGAVVDAYDEGGLNNLLQTKAEHFEFRKITFAEILSCEGNIGFNGIIDKINNFTDAILTHRSADVVGQKCGMDDPRAISIDLKGNVITCQNVSSVEQAMNGESHLGGNIKNIDDVKITTATHWKNRPNCSSCPVVQICRGSCMFLEGEYWNSSCDNAYSDAVVMFAHSIQLITGGYIPIKIEAEGMPPERMDIWGVLQEHEEKPKRRVIKIQEI